ncbi:hypothetical protein C1H46_020720 [Malus baccata]|uniref:Uncharacterized protein n=1 Tax=Malus baccata TaxID=106549 RepID=A0A540M4V5_MALBA|nr:hypothetical protein C1H46_020720 [Malus baccata]
MNSLGAEHVRVMASDYNSVHGNIYADLYKPAVIIGACFTAVALVLSIFLIFQHLRSYNKPSEQKWLVAVVFMVPVYATESILSLWNPNLSLACDILRNCYEAFALYSFGSYLVACLGGERKVIELLENQSEKLLNRPLIEGVADDDHTVPHWSLRNFFVRPSVLGKHLLNIEKFGLVQYMILKTVCAFLALVLELFGVYGDGEFKWYYGYVIHADMAYFSGILHGCFRCASLDASPTSPMAIAAVAHMFVFSTEPYHYITAYEYGKVTTETTKAEVKLEEGDAPARLEKTETKVEAPGTSITESVQDIVVDGGQRVVKDVVLTINQAIGPVEKGVEKGVTKIQETLHHRTVDSESGEHEDKSEVEVEEQVGNTVRETHIDL